MMVQESYVATLQFNFSEKTFDKLCNLIWSFEKSTSLAILLFSGFADERNGEGTIVYTLRYDDLRQPSQSIKLSIIRTLLEQGIAELVEKHSILPESFDKFLLMAPKLPQLRPLKLNDKSKIYIVKASPRTNSIDKTIKSIDTLTNWDFVIRADLVQDSFPEFGTVDETLASILVYKNFVVNYNAIRINEQGKLEAASFETYSFDSLLSDPKLKEAVTNRKVQRAVQDFIAFAKVMTI